MSRTQERVRLFMDARPTMKQYDSPEHLVDLLQGEIDEFAQEIPTGDIDKIRLELADIAVYLLQLGNYYNVDILGSVFEKLDKNEVRFPAELFQDHTQDFRTVYLNRKRELGEIT